MNRALLPALLGLFLLPACRSHAQIRPPEKLLDLDATEIKYHIGTRAVHEAEETSFLDAYLEKYVRARAYPGVDVDQDLRVRALRQLTLNRRAVGRPHIPAVWADEPGIPNPGPPGTCAWTSVGPTNINGRVTGIAVNPKNSKVLLVTSVGGIWRSSDGGRRWRRVSDSIMSTVFTSPVYNPEDPTEVFAGSGDPNYATFFNYVYGSQPKGIGIWRSASGGAAGTWQKVTPATLDNRTIFRLRIDPVAPHNLYAATSDGVYLGTRSGTDFTWSRLGGFDAWTTDIAVDFSVTPRLVYAGVARANSAAYGLGIWKYNGTAWNKRSSGIVSTATRVIALALAPTSPGTLYAKIEKNDGTLLGVYKTTTGAESQNGQSAWLHLINGDIMDDCNSKNLNYSWYNSVIEVDPNDDKTVYAAGLNVYRSKNGGIAWEKVSGGADPDYPFAVHSDNHAFAFDPVNSRIVYDGGDGGINRTTDTAQSVWHWADVSHGMVMTEFYRLTSQQMTATLVAGGSQDNGTEITFGNRTWYNPGGCDGADVAVDAKNSDTLYGNCNGNLYELVNPVPGTPGGTDQFKYTAPSAIKIIPPLVSDPSVAGAALAQGNSGQLMKTADGQSWSTASPAFPFGRGISFIAIAPSSGFKTYYVGLVGNGAAPAIWRTADGGGIWTKDSAGLPNNLSPNAAAVDDTNPARAFAAFGGNAGGGVYLTVDTGATWQAVNGTGDTALPNTPVTGIVIDPNDPNSLYVATDIGVFRGKITPAANGNPATAEWIPFDEGLPEGMDVNDIWVNRQSGFLLIGTMGHGAYQRDIRPFATCQDALLVVRDNVFDTGSAPSPNAVPDPEHPVPDPARPGFYKPNDSTAGKVYWWSSPDIRIDVPDLAAPANLIEKADHVEMESCPTEVSNCPPGTIQDTGPEPGHVANVYVQMNNRGLKPAYNVKVTALWSAASSPAPLLPPDFWGTSFPAGTSGCGALDESTGWHFVDEASPCHTVPVANPELPEVAKFVWNVPSNAPLRASIMVFIEDDDDPIDPNVRSSNERRPWVLVPQNRQISFRNLHVTNLPVGTPFGAGLIPIKIPGIGPDPDPLTLVFSDLGIGEGGKLAVLLPAVQNVRTQGVHTVRPDLTRAEAAEAENLGLDPSVAYELTGPEGALGGLPVPPGQTWNAGLLYSTGGAGKPDTAVRFSMLTQQGQTVVGGSTFVVKFSAPPGLRKLGDVSYDGSVDVLDAVLTLRYIVGLTELDADQFDAADVTEDEAVDVNDAIAILRIVVGG